MLANLQEQIDNPKEEAVDISKYWRDFGKGTFVRGQSRKAAILTALETTLHPSFSSLEDGEKPNNYLFPSQNAHARLVDYIN